MIKYRKLSTVLLTARSRQRLATSHSILGPMITICRASWITLPEIAGSFRTRNCLRSPSPGRAIVATRSALLRLSAEGRKQERSRPPEHAAHQASNHPFSSKFSAGPPRRDKATHSQAAAVPLKQAPLVLRSLQSQLSDQPTETEASKPPSEQAIDGQVIPRGSAAPGRRSSSAASRAQGP